MNDDRRYMSHEQRIAEGFMAAPRPEAPGDRTERQRRNDRGHARQMVRRGEWTRSEAREWLRSRT